MAEELGLESTQASGIGWSESALPDATAERYADALAALAALERAMTTIPKPYLSGTSRRLDRQARSSGWRA